MSSFCEPPSANSLASSKQEFERFLGGFRRGTRFQISLSFPQLKSRSCDPEVRGGRRSRTAPRRREIIGPNGARRTSGSRPEGNPPLPSAVQPDFETSSGRAGRHLKRSVCGRPDQTAHRASRSSARHGPHEQPLVQQGERSPYLHRSCGCPATCPSPARHTSRPADPCRRRLRRRARLPSGRSKKSAKSPPTSP